MNYQTSDPAPGRIAEPVALDISDLLELRSTTFDNSSRVLQENLNFPGQRPSNRRGHGLEFEDLREYTPGDDLRFIDWNVTARTTRLHTRLYRDERERTTTVVADLRPCMFTGTEALKARRAVCDAARVLWNAIANGDRCGAVIFDGISVEASRPLRGEAGVVYACQLLAQGYNRNLDLNSSATEAKVPDSTSGLEELLQFLLGAGRLSGYCFIFSSGDYLEQVETRLLQEISGKGQLLWLLILDQVETDGLPVGSYGYHVDTKTNNNLSGGAWQKLIANIIEHNQEQLADRLSDQLSARLALFEQHAIPVMTLDKLEADRYLNANLSALQLV